MLKSLGRLLARADSPAEILPMLVDAAIEHVPADGAAIVELLPSGDGRIVASRGLPAELDGWRGDVETIDAELGERLLAANGERFSSALTLPITSGRDMFGALVLFFAQPASLQGRRHAVAHELVDLAGIALSRAFQTEELGRSYAELRATRDTLERTQKLRALGEMAAGVSHDLKNILNPLSLHLQLLKRSLKRGGEGADEAIAEMELIVRRGVETLDRLRAFSRQSPEARFELTDINAVAREAIELSKPRLSSTARSRGIRLKLEPGAPPAVMARTADFVAAVVNLGANAVDAMPDGGEITVTTGPRDAGGWVQVTDDGPGIPEELQHRIFEPFFTTKGREGTGLGLAMVYAFVQRHGGNLTLETWPGKGTTFTLWFPAAAEGGAPG